MTDKLHDYAQSTTPSGVNVPNTIGGLIVWAVGKVGTAAIWASVAYVGLWIVYTDLRALNDKVLTAFVKQTETNAQMAETLKQMADELHRRNP